MFSLTLVVVMEAVRVEVRGEGLVEGTVEGSVAVKAAAKEAVRVAAKEEDCRSRATVRCCCSLSRFADVVIDGSPAISPPPAFQHLTILTCSTLGAGPRPAWQFTICL